MNTSEISVLVGSGLVLALMSWFFFAPRRATQTLNTGGAQSIEILVKGGYSPDTISEQNPKVLQMGKSRTKIDPRREIRLE